MSDTKSDWCFLGINDTKDWIFPPKLAHLVDKVLAVYFYDRNVCTHCCEITPSYWMTCVDFSVYFKPEATEKQREEIFDLINNVPKAECSRYAHVASTVTYALEHPELHHVVGDLSEEEDQEEELHEIWHRNPKF
jgi:hypothetical protein